MEKRFLSKKELATLVGVTIVTISRWMKDGKISYLKIGRRVLFQEQKVLAQLNQYEQKNESNQQPLEVEFSNAA